MQGFINFYKLKLVQIIAMGHGETDLAKAASGLAELASLLQEDLTGLEVVEG